jgi:hypothetical protein
MTLGTIPMKEYKQLRIDGRLIAGGNIWAGMEQNLPNEVQDGDLLLYGQICAHNFIAFGTPDMVKTGDFFVPGNVYQVSLR